MPRNNGNLVYVVTRVGNEDDTDHVIGVWKDEASIAPDLKEIFEWTTEVWIRGAWVMGRDRETEESGVLEIAYITRCFIQ